MRQWVTWLFVFVAALALGNRAGAVSIGDTLTVIQRPLLNIPAIVRPGDTLEIECEADPGTSGWAAAILHDGNAYALSVVNSVYNTATAWWEVNATIPQIDVYDIYDLVVTADGGLTDTTKHAVKVIEDFKTDYYFIHVTDPHLPTHLYYYQQGSDTDSSEVVDLREVIKDINTINPEFVLLTGDLVNEGELEDYLSKRYYSRAERLLQEFEVPVYLTSGNHDIGGWDDTPPPDGTARRDWWRFFGWKRLDNPPPGVPWHTQNYSFDYGSVHFVGLEAYINYDSWRSDIYGSQSFTSGQLEWLNNDLTSASGSLAKVLFYHYDFSSQINLNNLGVDMALSGHVHHDEDDFTHPYDIITNNVCDGERSYRLIRVSAGVLEPAPTLSAGSEGNNLTVTFSPDNDGTNYTVTAIVTNNQSERFEHGLIRFIMPNEQGVMSVTGGTLLQVDTSGPYATWYVGVDILVSSSLTVTANLDVTPAESPTVTVITPNGDETWEVGSVYDVTWTATDDEGVTSVDILLSTDAGVTFSHTIATGEANDGVYTWLVDVVPTSEARVKVVAYDGGGNSGEDMSDGDFEIYDPSAAIAESGMPAELVLTGIRPNPVMEHAALHFVIPTDGDIEIMLYDVSGRLVARLADGCYTAGYHSVSLKPESDVRSGIYFVNLRLGSESTTRKIVISR